MSKNTEPEEATDWGSLNDVQVDTLKRAMRGAVHDGLKDLLEDEELVDKFFSSAFVALRKNAQMASGGFLLGLLGKMASKMFWAAVLATVIYMAGGFPALAAWWKNGGFK